MGNSEDTDNNQMTQDNQEDSTGGGQGGGGKRKKAGGDSRNAAAKAFYRAMYAGAEPDPEDFGLGDQGGGDPKTCAFCERLQSDLQQVEEKAAEAEKFHKRLAADFENYRKRMQREKDEFSALGIQRAIETILPALDDMDMAKQKLNADMDSQAILDSLNLVYSRFARCLEQIGIKQLEVIGEQFDPKFHEPVQQVVTNEVPDGSIYQQLRPGYMIGDKVLRPTLVNVATNDGGVVPQPSLDSASQEGDSEQPSDDQPGDEPSYDQEQAADQEQADDQQESEQSGEEPDQQDLEDDVVTLEPGEFRANLTQDLPIYEIDEDALNEEAVEDQAEN